MAVHQRLTKHPVAKKQTPKPEAGPPVHERIGTQDTPTIPRLVSPSQMQAVQRTYGNRAATQLARRAAARPPRPVAITAAPQGTHVQRSIFYKEVRLPEPLRGMLNTYLTTDWLVRSKLRELDDIKTSTDAWLGKWRPFGSKATRKLVEKLKRWIPVERADLEDYGSVDRDKFTMQHASSIPERIDALIQLGDSIQAWERKHGIRYARRRFGRATKVDRIKTDYKLTPNKMRHAKALKQAVGGTIGRLKEGLAPGDKMLHMSVILEVVDRQHRAGRMHELVFGKWLKESDDSYWTYVADYLETEEEGSQYTVKFMTPEERAEKKVTFDGNKAMWGDVPVTKPQGGGEHSNFNKVIFAMDGSYQFYATQETWETGAGKENRIHHSSFFGGSAIRAAGTLGVTNDGTLQKVTADSGHYQPGPLQMIYAVIGLKKAGVDLSAVTITPGFRADPVKASAIYRCVAREHGKNWRTMPTSTRQVKRLIGFEMMPGEYIKQIKGKVTEVL